MQPTVPAAPQPPKGKKKKSPVLTIIVILLIVAAVAVAAFFALRHFGIIGGKGKDSGDSTFVYVKDNELYVRNIKDREGIQLTYGLGDSGYSVSQWMIEEMTYITADGKYIYFFDDLDMDNENFNIYRLDLTKSNAERQFLISGAAWYAVSEDGSIVTFYYEPDASLQSLDVNTLDSYIISSNGEAVYSLHASADGSVLYSEDDGSIYLWTQENGNKTLTDDGWLYHVSEDFTTVIYSSGDEIRKYENGTDTCLVEYFDYLDQVNSDGTFYYGVDKEFDLRYSDFVSNLDKLDSSAGLTSSVLPPACPVYPGLGGADSATFPDSDKTFLMELFAWYDAYYNVTHICDTADDDYSDAIVTFAEAHNNSAECYAFISSVYEEYVSLAVEEDAAFQSYMTLWTDWDNAYSADTDGQSLKDELETSSYTVTSTVLYYFDGQSSKKLFNGYDFYAARDSEGGSLAFYGSDLDKCETLADATELSDISELQELISDWFYDGGYSRIYLASGGHVGQITQFDEDTNIYSMRTSGGTTYIFSYSDNVSEGDLYAVNLGEDGDVYCGLLDSGVYGYYTYYTESGLPVYTTDCGEEYGVYSHVRIDGMGGDYLTNLAVPDGLVISGENIYFYSYDGQLCRLSSDSPDVPAYEISSAVDYGCGIVPLAGGKVAFVSGGELTVSDGKEIKFLDDASYVGAPAKSGYRSAS